MIPPVQLTLRGTVNPAPLDKRLRTPASSLPNLRKATTPLSHESDAAVSTL